MLAFYGWTDTLLINMVNTKVSFYRDEPADLFILKLARVSEELVQAIRKSGVFVHVFEIDMPSFHINKGSLKFHEKVLKLFSGWRYRRHYFKVLDSSAGNTRYRIFFSAAFWSETLFLFAYFRKANPLITITLVEEGHANYRGKDCFFQCLPNGRFKELLIRWFYFPFIYNLARKRTMKMFLYQPQLCYNASELQLERLPKLAAHNICLDILKDSIAGFDFDEYAKRNVYFFLPPIRKDDKDTCLKSLELLDALCQVITSGNLIIKPHPERLGEELDLWKRLDPLVFVEQRKFFLEALFTSVDVDNKILIVRDSSCATYPKYMLGKEPYVIFLHRIYWCYQDPDDGRIDQYAQNLKMIYEDEEKVMTPSSVSELIQAVKKILSIQNQ